MLVSLKCLSQFVDLHDLNSEEIASKLTFSGVEVEEVKPLASGTSLVIGEIIDCEKHPNSDHLHVLNVNLGSKYGVKQIVCGAPNVKKGLKVIVSREGAKLPGGEIKHSVIRGIDSFGMCCSLKELGVDSKYLTEYQLAGIEELPNDAPVGREDVLTYLGLDDVILNISVLANRPDLLSIYNVAREVAALFSRKVNIPKKANLSSFDSHLSVKSLTNKCAQFAGKEIRNIHIKPSPKWLSNYLMAMGVRSINNIVDIGNYVMLLTGQPLHMYDADKLPRNELVVKDDYKGSFVALDEKTYDIIPGDIVITSDDKVMCLGGIMGGLSCAVTPKTKNIIIESASFEAVNIRHTSSRLGLMSESSNRFVKGTFHFQYGEVINLASELINELCETNENGDTKSFLEEKYQEKTISTSTKYINGRLGTKFSFVQIQDVLTRLHFSLTVKNQDEFLVKVPSFRLDINEEADISEEIIRVLGFDNVTSSLPTFDVKVGALTLSQNRIKLIRNYLLGCGLDECLTYSLLKKKDVSSFNLVNHDEGYVLLNPITDEHQVFRTHILHSLISVAGYNVAHQNKDLALFEVSSINTKQNISTHLAIVLVGNRYERGIMFPKNYDFYDIKGLVEGLFMTLGIEKNRFRFVKCLENSNELHPGRSSDIVFQNQIIGKCGEVHPSIYDKYGLGKTKAVVLEIDLNTILEAKVGQIKFTQISKFPTVNHDLALIVDKNLASEDIIKCIKKNGCGLINDVQVFDVYEGNLISENKKSIAIKISYSSFEHTLNDKEVNDAEDKIKFELFKNFRAELRK